MFSDDAAKAVAGASREAADWGSPEIEPLHLLCSMLRTPCLLTSKLALAHVDPLELRDLLRVGAAAVGSDPVGLYEINGPARRAVAQSLERAAAHDRHGIDSIDLAIFLLEDPRVRAALLAFEISAVELSHVLSAVE